MRTFVGVASAGWFLVTALLIGDGSSGLIGEPPNQEIFGDPVVMAIHLVGRILLVGLGLLSLALVDPAAIRGAFRQP